MRLVIFGGKIVGTFTRFTEYPKLIESIFGEYGKLITSVKPSPPTDTYRSVELGFNDIPIMPVTLLIWYSVPVLGTVITEPLGKYNFSNP